MKPAILLCLFICAYLTGTTNLVRAEGKHKTAAHSGCNILQSKHVDKDEVIDIEDDNDDESLTRKVIVPARLLSSISSVLITATVADPSTNVSGSACVTYAPRDIIIIQHSLRI